jgi:hypothetical protein
VATDPRGPETFEFTPQGLSHMGSVAECVNHRPDLAPLVRMGASDDSRGLEAERYFARGADRVFPGRLWPKTSS